MRRIGGITLEQLCARRPYLYHLTARRNLSFIQETRKLLPAAALLTRSGRADMLRIRRCQHTEIFIDEFPVMIRDQAPLISGNVVFSEGYSITDSIESLNNRVFFWPGRESGPISYGVRHFKRYRYENPAMLKIDTRALASANGNHPFEFCQYNSGSPRCSGGRKSPRGPQTFRSASGFRYSVGKIVEVTLPGETLIPTDSWIGPGPHGPWKRLINEPARDRLSG